MEIFMAGMKKRAKKTNGKMMMGAKKMPMAKGKKGMKKRAKKK